MSTAPSNSAPKTPEQSLKPMSPPKKSDNLKQTMLILSAAMVGDNTKVSALSNVVFRERANHRRKGSSQYPREKKQRD